MNDFYQIDQSSRIPKRNRRCSIKPEGIQNVDDDFSSSGKECAEHLERKDEILMKMRCDGLHSVAEKMGRDLDILREFANIEHDIWKSSALPIEESSEVSKFNLI